MPSGAVKARSKYEGLLQMGLLRIEGISLASSGGVSSGAAIQCRMTGRPLMATGPLTKAAAEAAVVYNNICMICNHMINIQSEIPSINDIHDMINNIVFSSIAPLRAATPPADCR